MFRFLTRIFKRTNNIFYIANGTEILPEKLSADEEFDCVERMKKGCDEAKNQLIERNLRLVVYTAQKFENTNVAIEDLISIGTIGLIKAVSSFDNNKNIKLATYASRCIENEILMHLRAGKKNRGELMLYDPIGSDKEGNEIVLMDILCQDWDTVADEVESHLEEKKLIEKLSKLSKRERKVIQLRFGIGTDHRLTQREISQVLGISRSYVSRIEKRALNKLHNDMVSEGYQ